MKHIKVQKSGWNANAALLGPIWYLLRGMTRKGMFMLLICICTLGIGIIPIWIYCGFVGNKDFYKFLKKRNVYIYH